MCSFHYGPLKSLVTTLNDGTAAETPTRAEVSTVVGRAADVYKLASTVAGRAAEVYKLIATATIRAATGHKLVFLS